jgi:hypothetical protein
MKIKEVGELWSNETSLELVELSNKLVPGCGKCDTLEGEIVRAANRISYRWLNDGDRPTIGYGAETAGPALYFLLKIVQDNAIVGAASKVEDAAYASELSFTQTLEDLNIEVVKYVKQRIKDDNLTENEIDMLDYYEQAQERWPQEDECDECGYEEAQCDCDEDDCEQCGERYGFCDCEEA